MFVRRSVRTTSLSLHAPSPQITLDIKPQQDTGCTWPDSERWSHDFSTSSQPLRISSGIGRADNQRLPVPPQQLARITCNARTHTFAITLGPDPGVETTTSGDPGCSPQRRTGPGKAYLTKVVLVSALPAYRAPLFARAFATATHDDLALALTTSKGPPGNKHSRDRPDFLGLVALAYFSQGGSH